MGEEFDERCPKWLHPQDLVFLLDSLKPGLGPAQVGIASVGGLSATYYSCAEGSSGETCQFGAPAKTVTDATVDFSSVEAAPGYEVTWPTPEGPIPKP